MELSQEADSNYVTTIPLVEVTAGTSTAKSRLVKSVDLRCPIGPKRLLAVVRQTEDYHGIVEGNLLELACRDCRNFTANAEGRKPQFVLHRFNVLGELVESEIVWPE